MQSRKQIRRALPLLCGVLVSALFAGCFPDTPPDPGSLPDGGMGGTVETGGESETGASPSASAGSDEQPLGDAGAPTTGKCLPVTGELLLQRSSILSNGVEPTEKEIALAEVYNKFKVQCGACHHEQALGGFQVLDKDYSSSLKNPKILELIQSDDRNLAMPSLPPVPYSRLPADSSLKILVKLLKEWNEAGNPPGVFYEKLPAGSGQSPYALSTDLGMSFTNIGTCMPDAGAYAYDRSTMETLDEAFARRKPSDDENANPQDKIGLPLDLADTDFTSFDSQVLARRGLVAFAPAYPLWSDDAGKLRYVRVPLGQSIQFDAKSQRFNIPENTRFYKTFLKEVVDINGNKRWRKLETRLIVARHDLTTPDDPAYKPQALFGSYEWDEAETHATLLTDTLRNGEPFSDHLFGYVADEPAADVIRQKKPRNLTFELENAKVARHWAVPGSQRCIHCHEGSLEDNFIIGFTPLQLNRRKLGEGGVYEAPTKDELGQFQRLIDLGVISGIRSADEVVKLEDTQALANPPRAPRNDQELKAQAYLLANCSHCHNQNGFPSVSAKELKDTLNFYPGKRESETVVGGVFQFPLDKVSPRIQRFDHQGIPYITPSMRDVYPPDGKDYTSKDIPADDPDSAVGLQFLNAPWRSLIYRNVKTAFTYSEAGTLYPHMPFDTGGHDCRASQWLGEWMVSIPAVRKHPDVSDVCGQYGCPDDEAQPYLEVVPGQDGYEAAVADAKSRLKVFKTDKEYSTCPDGSDIVDPEVSGGFYPSPRDITGDGVPDHANWVVTDLTERKGLWSPRRDDWQKVLVDHVFPPPPPSDSAGVELDKQKAIVAQLGSIHLSEVEGFAATKFPLALWKNKPGCNFGGVDKVKALTGDQRPLWFDRAHPDPEAPVFAVRPGQAVFDMICINCHGPNADSLGRQADTLQNLTGGSARVANFRFGLFNPGSFDEPYDKPDLGLQTNRQRVFGPISDNSVSPDDWGARYLAWMALGGTNVHIPEDILKQVANTDVGGVHRSTFPSTQRSANMLQVAQSACAAVLGEDARFNVGAGGNGELSGTGGYPLIVENGDLELWRKICSIGNPLMVRVIRPYATGNGGQVGSAYLGKPCDAQGQPAHCYPQAAPVGNERGEVVPKLQAENSFPWCLDPSNVLQGAELEAYAAQYPLHDIPLPICPADWFANREASLDWPNRGAINAGFLVFKFLDAFIKGDIAHIGYDQCELLTGAK